MIAEAATDIRLVPLARLSVDSAYQRKLDENWLKFLMDNWDEDKCDVMHVSSRPDGRLVVLDGQHQLATRRQLASDGVELPQSVMAKVYFGLSAQREAEIFLGLNNQKAVHTIDKYKARCAAGDPAALAVRATLLSHGASIQINSRTGYACVGVMYKLLEWGVLEPTIRIIEGTWLAPTLKESKLKHARQLVEGTGIFVLRAQGHPGFSLDRAIERFRVRVNLQSLLEGAKRDTQGTSVSQAVAIAQRLRAAYNVSVPSGNRIAEIVPPKGYRG